MKNVEIINLKVLSIDRKLGLLYSKSNGFPFIEEFVMQSCSPYKIVFLCSPMTKYESTTKLQTTNDLIKQRMNIY
jgi:hypothetical protein